MSILDLWGAFTKGCSRLPEEKELEALFHQAGYKQVRTRDLLSPYDSFLVARGEA